MASTASTTPLNICARALVLIGADQISSFDDVTVEGTVSTAMYEDMVRSTLASHRWRFATKQVALVANGTDPVSRFDSAYTLPSDALSVSAVTINDCPIEYDIYTNYIDAVSDDTIIACDATANDTVVIDYIVRRDEASWPAYFTTAMTYVMAHVFSLSIARDGQMAQVMEGRASVLLAKARSLDSQQQTTRKLRTSRFISQRRS